MGHCVLETGGVVIGRVELDADAEVGGDERADLVNDIEDEFGALFCAATVGVRPDVALISCLSIQFFFC